MTPAEHYTEAEQMLTAAKKYADRLDRFELFAEAQVHATLAMYRPPEWVPTSDAPPIFPALVQPAPAVDPALES